MKNELGSLIYNGSQGGNGLLHLVHISSGELEHRSDGRLLGELELFEGLVSGLHLNESQPKRGDKRNEGIGMKNLTRSYHPVGPSNLEGSTLGKESLGEGAKFLELTRGRLGLSLLVHQCLSQLVSLVLHF